jgi:hypothetical protein
MGWDTAATTWKKGIKQHQGPFGPSRDKGQVFTKLN